MATSNRAATQPFLDEVRRIALSVLDGASADVYLFGSWARGEKKRTSDIDLGIVPNGSISPGLLAELWEALEESDVPYRVDVVDLSQVTSDFRRRATQEGILWTDG